MLLIMATSVGCDEKWSARKYIDIHTFTHTYADVMAKTCSYTRTHTHRHTYTMHAHMYADYVKNLWQKHGAIHTQTQTHTYRH
jgi:hypothetical protein